MDERDLAPVTVFSGPYTEAIVLQSMLEAEGIPCSVDTPFLGGLGAAVPIGGTGFPQVFVRRSDAARAQAVVDEFIGNRSADSAD